jgi:hypothetical protein
MTVNAGVFFIMLSFATVCAGYFYLKEFPGGRSQGDQSTGEGRSCTGEGD